MKKGPPIPGFAGHYDAFVREGLMVAMPLGFPGATTMIPADESRITALAINRDDHFETVWGGTSGRKAHLFFAWLRGVTGIIVDLGGDGESTETAGVVCTDYKVVAALNGPSGGRLMVRHYHEISYDCIQEWFVDVKPFERAADLPGERITGIERDARGRGVVVLTSRGLASWVPGKPVKCGPDAELTAMARDGAGKLLGVGRDGAISEIVESAKGMRIRKAGEAKGDFRKPVWSGAFPGKPLYLADARGTLFEVTGRKPPRKVGCAFLAPVSCMAVIRDGRLFGFCGEEISHMFEYDPATKKVRDIGVALSLLNRRRYGYEFGCATATRDGHIFFGENDRGGHLWLFFPRLT